MVPENVNTSTVSTRDGINNLLVDNALIYKLG